MRVGADAAVWVGESAPVAFNSHNGSCQVFNVYLVHNAGAGRYYFKVLERGLTPAQELVALAVALILILNVALSCICAASNIDYYGVVNHHLGRRQRVDLLRVSPELGNCLAHGCEVYDAGHAGEVLHDHPCWRELNLLAGFGIWVPVSECLNVLAGDVCPVLGAQQVF